MGFTKFGRARLALGVAGVAMTLAACSDILPRTGPNKREIFAGSVQRQGNAYVISVNDRVLAATKARPEMGFGPNFTNQGQITADTLRPGDVISVMVYENVDEGLLGTGGAPSRLDQLQIDQSGHIFMPYAGRIKAAGNTPEALRRIITEKLDIQTPDPQVVVSREPGDGASVTIVGQAGGQGVFPIEAPTRTLIGMIAEAGGVQSEPEQTRITLIRGADQATVWLQDLYSRPGQDIALRGGDKILIQEDKRRFVALGATGGQSLVDFPKPTLTAIEAIAQMGGLNSQLADPTGIFILRTETADYANRVLGRDDFQIPKRFAYVLDLTEPTGMFLAREFDIRDGDTIYVTEAPYVQWTKVLSVLTSTTSSVSGLANTAQGL